MKNLLLFCLFFISLFTNAQNMSKSFLQGHWTSKGEATEMWVNVNQEGIVTINESCSYTGEALNVLEYQITKEAFYVKTFFEKNNWKSITKFTIVDKNTMSAYISSDSPEKIIYIRVKNK